jgi:RNA polymerase sigma factor (sigma-70 family)
MEQLLRQHGGLVHWAIRRDCRSALSYGELWHERQVALWQAIRGYDPGRGLAFSTYAVPVIRHRLWTVVAQAQRPQGYVPRPAVADPAELAAQAWQLEAVRSALRDMLACLPERAAQIIVGAYGLDGQPPRSLAALGRLHHVSRERVRQIHNEALVLLRRPACSGRLRQLCDHSDRAAYQRAQTLNRTWLRRRRRGGAQ